MLFEREGVCCVSVTLVRRNNPVVSVIVFLFLIPSLSCAHTHSVSPSLPKISSLPSEGGIFVCELSFPVALPVVHRPFHVFMVVVKKGPTFPLSTLHSLYLGFVICVPVSGYPVGSAVRARVHVVTLVLDWL